MRKREKQRQQPQPAESIIIRAFWILQKSSMSTAMICEACGRVTEWRWLLLWALSSEISRSNAQGTVCSETAFSSVSLNTDTFPTTRTCSWELEGGWGLHPVHCAKSPWAGTIAMTLSKPRWPYKWHPHCTVLLPAHAQQALSFCYNCLVTRHCQMGVSAASFWKRLNCCCYLNVKYISLCWRAIEETALVQTWNRFQLNKVH